MHANDFDPVHIRKTLCAGDVRQFEYFFHPVAGNIVLLDLQDSPDGFWKIFSSLPVDVFENYGPGLFQTLDKASFPVPYLLALCRHCSSASLPILFWIVSRIAFSSPKKDYPLLLNALREKNVNNSALEMFRSASESTRRPLYFAQ